MFTAVLENVVINESNITILVKFFNGKDIDYQKNYAYKLDKFDLSNLKQQVSADILSLNQNELATAVLRAKIATEIRLL
jgi:hypothetical protein